MECDEEYGRIIEAVRKEYEPKILGLLRNIGQVCQGAGLTAKEPYSMCDDEYRWSLTVYRDKAGKDLDSAVDISVVLAEGREYDGGDGFGINFGLSVVEYGGRILGGLEPFNYTPDVWVDARLPLLVKDRWQIMQDADMTAIPALILEG